MPNQKLIWEYSPKTSLLTNPLDSSLSLSGFYSFNMSLERLKCAQQMENSPESAMNVVPWTPVPYSKKAKQNDVHYNNDGCINEMEGLDFLSFDIFCFIEYSIDRICHPFSGLDGD
jgi:hypothetical protein